MTHAPSRSHAPHWHNWSTALHFLRSVPSSSSSPGPCSVCVCPPPGVAGLLAHVTHTVFSLSLPCPCRPFARCSLPFPAPLLPPRLSVCALPTPRPAKSDTFNQLPCSRLEPSSCANKEPVVEAPPASVGIKSMYVVRARLHSCLHSLYLFRSIEREKECYSIYKILRFFRPTCVVMHCQRRRHVC